jgi:CRP/FNR family transcriptional regulator, cyclic AMP receptor protein
VTRHTMSAFSVPAFLDSSRMAETIVEYRRGETIFTQGDTCEDVLYIQTGGVRLSVSKTGREAVVRMLGPGEFFGEGCLAGQSVRTGSATAITPSVIVHVDKGKMLRLLREQRAVSDRFISHLLSRNIRIEEELLDQLFGSSEKRLARALLLTARYGQQGKPRRIVPKTSQDVLAKATGVTRSQVTLLLAKFRKLGFIEENGAFTIKRSLLSVLLKD